MRCGNPMDGPLDFAARGRAATFGIGINAALQFDDFPRRAFDDLVTFQDVGVTQADFAAGREAEKFLRRGLPEIVPFDVNESRERDLGRCGRRGLPAYY